MESSRPFRVGRYKRRAMTRSTEREPRQPEPPVDAGPRANFKVRCGTQAAAFVATVLLAVVHTWPMAARWRTHLAGGAHEDPWMNVWHLDWVRSAVLAGKSPFFADGLHWPLGAELYWHTLSPAKSLWGLVLVPWVGAAAAYNLVIFSTFILTGMTSFWLFADVLRRQGARHSEAALAAFVGASIFNFSRYHLCHAVAHMNLASLEGLPLYLFFFFRTLETGRRRDLVGAALSAGYVALCDFYYVYYLALLSVSWVALRVWRTGPLLSRDLLKHEEVRRSLWIGALAAVACLPAVLPLLMHLRPAALPLHHGDSDYPADPILLVMPDGLSLWQSVLPSAIARPLSKLQNGILNEPEGGLFLGAGAVFLSVVAIRARLADVGVWWRIAACFAVLSLGTHLHVGGIHLLPAQLALVPLVAFAFLSKSLAAKPYARDVRVGVALVTLIAIVLPITAWDAPATFTVPLPYLFFKHVVPLFGRGGMPVRFLLLSQVALAALASLGAFHLLRRRAAAGRPIFALALGLAVWVNAETKSVAMPMAVVPRLPPIFDVMRDESGTVAVFTDHVLGQWEQLHHRRPVSIARQSRLPVREKAFVDAPLHRALVDLEGDEGAWSLDEQRVMRAALHDGNYRYFVGHRAALELAAGRRGQPADVLGARRHALLTALGAEQVHADADRTVYRFR